jgi:hypothetical protein
MVNMHAGLPRLGTVCDEYRLGDPFSEEATDYIRSVIKADRRLAPDLPKRDCRFQADRPATGWMSLDGSHPLARCIRIARVQELRGSRVAPG